MMKRNRLIFYSVFGLLHLFIFIFSLYMDNQKNNFQFLINMQSKIWMLKYCSFLLLNLFVANVILHYRDNSRNNREKDQIKEELKSIKAKLYDLQDGSSKIVSDKPEKER